MGLLTPLGRASRRREQTLSGARRDSHMKTYYLIGAFAQASAYLVVCTSPASVNGLLEAVPPSEENF